MDGQAVFVCPECGEHFIAVDIDYRTSNHSIPMACPQCGTRTIDKYWNQTNIPDVGLIAIIIGCALLPFALWKCFKRLIDIYFYKTYFQRNTDDTKTNGKKK